MNKDLTAIRILIDGSGSMLTLREAVVSGLNNFVDEQKKVDGKVILTVTQFDSGWDGKFRSKTICHMRSLHELRRFDYSNYVPAGGTPLLNAMDEAIDEFGRDLAAMPEHERPSKVIFLTVTDGEENTSDRRFYDKHKLLAKTRHQQNTYDWKFVYLGSNQDSFAEAGGLGIVAHSTMNYAPTYAGTLNAFATASNSIVSYRSCQSDDVYLNKDDTNGK